MNILKQLTITFIITMEEILNTMRANQGKLNALGKSRAMEKQMQAPQLMDSNLLEPTTDAVISGKGMSQEARMKRVVGAGRKKKGASNGVMEGGAESEAMALGKKLASQLKEKHGMSFFDDFHKGLMHGGAGPISMPPSGIEVSSAKLQPATSGLAGQALGGQDVPPGGVAPIAYGSVPQAPASFQRNTVGMGRKQTRKDKEDEKLGMEVSILKKKVKGGAMCDVQRTVDASKKMKGGAKCSCGGAKKKGGQMRRAEFEPTPVGQTVERMATEVIARPPPRRMIVPRSELQGDTGATVSLPKRIIQGDTGGTPYGGAKKSSKRGQMISKLMKEKGMQLGQASKYLKDHPELLK